MKKEKILKLCCACREILKKSKEKHAEKNTCIHNRQKWLCKECDGGAYCEHKKRRNVCVECHGATICEHNKIRHYCSQCKALRCANIIEQKVIVELVTVGNYTSVKETT